MHNVMKPIALALTIFALPTMTANVPGLTQFASVAQAEEKQTKKVPAMRERVYSQLARAQQLADDGDVAAGLEVLTDIRDRLDSMNSYERAMYWNFSGFINYNNDKIEDAMSAFKNVVAEEAIPESLRLSTLYSLAQLYMMQDNYDEALVYLSKWKDANTKPLKANDYVLFAQAYYQNKDFENSLSFINNAVDLAEAENDNPKENWLILQRASYYELKQPEKVAEVLEKMVRLYNKPEYWVQLGGMYGELEQEDKQLAVMEAAWQAGYLKTKGDILNLAQLYLYHDVPFKAADVLEKSIDTGLIEGTVKNKELLATSLILAKEDTKARPVLIEVAAATETGKYDAQLAELYLNNEQWQLAIDSANAALDKGELKNEGNAHMVLGMAYFNLKRFDRSISALDKASEFKRTKAMANQWARYVGKEKESFTQLAMMQEQ